MSSRLNMSRYMHQVPIHVSPDDQPGLLSTIFGQDKTTGGPTIDPKTGEIAYATYQGSSGLFGRYSRRHAQMLNDAMMQQQILAQSERNLEQMREKHEANMEVLRGYMKDAYGDKEAAHAMEQVAAKGTEERKTEATKGEESRKTTRASQTGNLLTSKGFIPSDANEQLYNAQTANQLAGNEGARAAMEGRMLAAPGTEEAFTKGKQQEMLGPYARNIALLTREAGPNTAIFGPSPGLNWFGQEDIKTGPSERDVTELFGAMRDPKSGALIGGTPKTMREYGPPQSQAQIRDLINQFQGAPNAAASAGAGAINPFFSAPAAAGIGAGIPSNIQPNIGMPNMPTRPPLATPPIAPIPSDYNTPSWYMRRGLPLDPEDLSAYGAFGNNQPFFR